MHHLRSLSADMLITTPNVATYLARHLSYPVASVDVEDASEFEQGFRGGLEIVESLQHPICGGGGALGSDSGAYVAS